jgi:formate hydrogenlyase subunit 3/multisubunit Na+/H+ antiporter MnhD subunit
MLILLTIFLFVFTPLAMLILHLVRPKLGIQGLLAILAVMSGLPMVLLAKSDIPRVILLLQWKPEFLFPISPTLVIDDISWYFALALTTLSFSVVIISIAQLGQSTRLDLLSTKDEIRLAKSPNTPANEISPATTTPKIETNSSANWSFWAAILILTSLGLLAVTSGNMLTLLLAWVALDIFELIILLGHVFQSKTRKRVILVFSAKLAGIVALLTSGLILWSHGASLSFDAISQTTSVYIILAAGLRLGVLPLQLPLTQGLPIRHGLGTALRLVPAASSYILIVRVSNMGIPSAITPYLLGLTILAGLFAAINWIHARDEVDGRPYWLLGIASLAVATAILNHSAACLTWCIAGLLSGGLIFSISLRHRNLIPLVFLGVFNLSSLPFSPTWQGTTLYQYSSNSGVNLTIFSLFSFLFILIQSFLLAGFIRYFLREIYPPGEESSKHIERWVWLLYPIALILLVVIHFLIGWLLYPNLNGLSIYGWIIGPITLIFTGLILYIAWRHPQPSPLFNLAKKDSFWKYLFSLEWLYRFLWGLFHLISRLFSLFSTILEGDGGILWALVLFALIFVFLQR